MKRKKILDSRTLGDDEITFGDDETGTRMSFQEDRAPEIGTLDDESGSGVYHKTWDEMILDENKNDGIFDEILTGRYDEMTSVVNQVYYQYF